MLQLDLHNHISNKGIQYPGTWLVHHGISRHSAIRMLNQTRRMIDFDHLEKLCTAFNCTPNDLLVWIPGKEVTNLEKHPLQKLRRKQDEFSVSDKLKTLSPEKLEVVKEFLKELDNG